MWGKKKRTLQQEKIEAILAAKRRMNAIQAQKLREQDDAEVIIKRLQDRLMEIQQMRDTSPRHAYKELREELNSYIIEEEPELKDLA